MQNTALKLFLQVYFELAIKTVECHFSSSQTTSPWKDPDTFDYDNVDFQQPAMMPGPDKSESHGGEDVAIYATGTVTIPFPTKKNSLPWQLVG
jgi:hypothetical protein